MGERLEREGISEIVVATDGAAHAEAAVEYGAWLAARTGARLSAAHVIDARRLAASRNDSDLAYAAARGVPGLFEVTNELRVESETAR